MSERRRGSEPLISVVMPVHDGERHLRAAVESMLGQSLGDLELIAVDDHSTDGTREILSTYEREDTRVRVCAPEQAGFVNAVSTGIAAASASWIARMDADDVSRPRRLERQWEYVNGHQEVAALGTSALVVADDGTPRSTIRYPLYDGLIRMSLRSSTTFAHGSVLFRREAVETAGGYRASAFPAEDYDLWCRLAGAGQVLANLDEPLYEYRLSASGTSRTQAEAQSAAADRIGRTYARSRIALPSRRQLSQEVRRTERDVDEGRADPRALRRAARSLVDAAAPWLGSRPSAAMAAMAAGLEAEVRYRRSRHRGRLAHG